jgi:hypothetical protein
VPGDGCRDRGEDAERHRETRHVVAGQDGREYAHAAAENADGEYCRSGPATRELCHVRVPPRSDRIHAAQWYRRRYLIHASAHLRCGHWVPQVRHSCLPA